MDVLDQAETSIMRMPPIAAIAAFALGLAGCQDEPEEVPDIEEAIPLDETGDGSAEDAGSEPNSIEPSAPPIMDGMESGSNPAGMDRPPAGSKVQPAD
jgi:hypothetical protein